MTTKGMPQFFFLFLCCCLTVSLLSGCGNRVPLPAETDVTVPTVIEPTIIEQAETESVPTLTAEEQAAADRLIERHGDAAMPHYQMMAQLGQT